MRCKEELQKRRDAAGRVLLMIASGKTIRERRLRNRFTLEPEPRASSRWRPDARFSRFIRNPSVILVFANETFQRESGDGQSHKTNTKAVSPWKGSSRQFALGTDEERRYQ